MTTYRITAPNGRTYQIEGPPGASDAQVAQAVIAQNPEAAQPPQETTVGGNVKEFFKGIVPGAIGLAESAAVGASALLPEDAEKATRQFVKETAATARKPFEAGAGYEESVGRKFGEAVGSTVPFLAAGPFGLAGRVAGTALGIGAGAGEARGRAEEGKATSGERGLSTALGAAVGATEMFVPMRILGRLADPIKEGAAAAIKRALIAGGEEGAQEAATQIAQNLIAKGIYKPEQAIIEQVGESAAYGGATGALVQGLLDLALGRRAKGAGTPGAIPDAEQKAQEARLRKEQLEREQGLDASVKEAQAQGYVGQQGQLFRGLEKPTQPQRDLAGQILEPAPDEAAPRPSEVNEGMPVTTATAQKAKVALTPEELEAAGQQQLGLEQAQDTEFFQQELDMLDKEYATLQGEKTKTPADNQRMREIRTRRTQITELLKQRTADRGPQIKQGQDQGELFTPAQLRAGQRSFTPIAVPAQSPARGRDVSTQEQSDLMLEATFEYADLVKMREQLKAMEQTPEVQRRIKYLDGQIRDYTLAGVDEAYRQRLEREASQPSPEQQAREAALAEQSAFAQQPEGQPVPEPTVRVKPTPATVPTLVSPEVLGVLGVGHSAIIRKADHPIQGLDIAKPEDAAEVKKMLTVYKEGKSAPIVQKVDEYLARPEFQGAQDVPTPATAQPAPAVSNQPRGSKRSVAVPVQPTATELPEPGAGAAPTTEATAAPDGRGLVPSGPDAGTRNEAPVGEQPAVKTPGTPTERQQRIAFGKSLGATQPYPGSLKGRVNKAAQSAAQRGDFPGVVAALEASKNVTVAEVARRAKALKTKIEIDDTAGETYEGRSAFQDQMSIDGAKMHLDALEKLRGFVPEVDALPDGASLPYSISGASIPAIQGGEVMSLPLRLQSIVENNNSMFAGLNLPEGQQFKTKEDFKNVLDAFERVTQEIGEPALRLTATASAIQQGVAGTYDADTDTIRVPDYFAKDEAVLAHEIVHAQALQAVANPTLAQRPAVQRLTKLYAHVKQVVDTRSKTEKFFRVPYGTASVQEFIAEGLSNPDFQFILSKIEYENTTAWSKFVENIARLLGVKNNTAFTELLTVYDELTQPTKQPATAKAEAKQVKPKKPKKPAGLFDALLSPGETIEPKVEAMAEEIVAKEAAASDEKPPSVWDTKAPSKIGRELQAEVDAKKDRRSVPTTATGQTIGSLQSEVANMPGPLGAALRRMLKSGKVKLEAAAPGGRKVAGLYDGKAVTLYANGIPEGQALAVALHEVGAHLGLKNLVGAKAYDALVARLQTAIEKADGSAESKMAQAAYKRIPIRDMKRGPEVFGDELLAYFVEEMALSEAAGTLPKVGALRNMWNRVKTGVLAAVNRVFGTSLGIDGLTAAQIQDMAKAAFTKESYTAVEGEASAQQERESVPGTAELDPASRAAIKALQDKLPVEERGADGVVGQAVQGMKRARETSGIITTFRQAAMDKYASVESKVSQMFSKGVRDSFGNLNPMVLARQAEDNAKIIMDFFRAGGIRLSKEGLIETFEQNKSMVSALNKVKDFAAANGMTYEEAKAEISTVLEGHRVHGIREYNKELEQSAIILTGKGKLKEAQQERDRKIDLHMTNAEIDAMEAIYQKSKGIQDIQSDLNATRTQAIDLMVATGRIAKEQGQFWKDNEAYVPFDRVFEEATAAPKFYRGKGLAVLRNIPTMEGSLGRPVRNVLDAYANRLSWMVEDTMRNNASVQLLETMELGGFARELPRPEAALNKNLVVPRLYRDGQPVHFEVQNEYDMLAFQQAPEIINGLTKALGATARILRVSITAMPPFAIKQVVDDAQRAAFYSGVQRPLVVAMKTLYNFPKVFFGEVTGRKSVAVKRMEELGIIGDYDFNIYEPVADIEKEIGAVKRGVAGKTFHRLEQITKASDLAARLAVYEETMRDTNGDELLAQTRARELINFTRRGSSQTMRTATRVIPFFNAYAQGMDVLYRSATGLDGSSSGERAAARRMFWSRVVIMTAFGFLYALAMSDDEGYKDATDEVRDNNWLLPGGYKIPVPKELAFIFKSIPERAIQYAQRYGTDEEQAATQALGSVVKAAGAAYGSPNAVPAFIRPLFENWTNYSFFLQRELESASMQRLEAGQRSTSSTSEFAKALGETTNVSPIKIDNFLRGTFGMAGSTTLLMTDALLNPSRPDRPLYQLPFASIFLYDTIGGRKKAEFYDLREKVAQADSTYKDLITKDPDKAEKYLEKNQSLIAAAPLINATLRDLSQMRALRTLVEQGTEEMLGMTGKERRELIDEIRASENELVSYTRELEKSLRE